MIDPEAQDQAFKPDKRQLSVQDLLRPYMAPLWRKMGIKRDPKTPWYTQPGAWFELLPLLVVLPFLFLFLYTAFSRLGMPMELEWNEGQAAEQAWRFAHGLPLYPSIEENWVPYMYGPFFHILEGTLFKITGIYSLAMGRVISLLSTFIAMMSIQYIVWDRTKKLVPSLFAAVLFLVFYKVSGYWYDLGRVDSLAQGLVASGLALCLKRKPKTWQGVLGMLLLMLSVFTKQLFGPIAVLAAIWLFVHNRKAAIIGGVPILIFTINVVFLSGKTGNEEFVNYVYENPLKHPSTLSAYIPGSISPEDFSSELENPDSRIEWAKLWVQKIWDGKPAPIWDQCFRHCWILILLVPVWLLLALVRRQWPRGWFYLFIAFLMSQLAISSFAKYGGYMNNFVPLFFSVSLISGFALNGILRALGGNRFIPVNIALAVVIALQIYQPWNLPGADDGAANWDTWKRQDQETRDQVYRYIDTLKAAKKKEAGIVLSEDSTAVSPVLLYQYGRWCSAGLLYIPSQQIPSEESRLACADLIEWLKWKAELEEKVWLIHHQWYGLITGHPMALNMDAIRCSAWAGDPVPADLQMFLESGKFQWVVLNNKNPDHDWLVGKMNEVIREHYDYEGKLPFYANYQDDRLLMPPTGAEVRPRALFRYKSFDGKVTQEILEMEVAPEGVIEMMPPVEEKLLPRVVDPEAEDEQRR